MHHQVATLSHGKAGQIGGVSKVWRQCPNFARYSPVPSGQHNMHWHVAKASMAARITTMESIGVGALPYLGLPE